MHHIPAEQFKQALGSFPSGVTVITARRPDGGPHGVTVSSFAALSLTPRLISFAITRNGESHTVLSAATHFAVHILAEGQEALSTHFARKGQAWDTVPHTTGPHGLPLLSGCVAQLCCCKAAQITPADHPVGDHDILIGEILSVTTDPKRRPLLYFRGDYTSLARQGEDA